MFRQATLGHPGEGGRDYSRGQLDKIVAEGKKILQLCKKCVVGNYYKNKINRLTFPDKCLSGAGPQPGRRLGSPHGERPLLENLKRIGKTMGKLFWPATGARGEPQRSQHIC